MNLYLLSQSENSGYDTYDSCVVVAKNEEDAKKISPCGICCSEPYELYCTWTHPKNVKVVFLGKLTNKSFKEKDVICSSFNAG